MELHNTDPFGNALPPNMFWRDGTYYVRASVAGERKKKSTGKTDFKSALRRYHEIMKSWNDGESGWSPSETPTLRAYWEKDYRPAWTVGLKTPLRGRTEYRDDQLMRVPLEDLGSRKLSDISPSVAQKWANRRRQMTYTRKKNGSPQQISEGTVHREVSLLQAIFAKAIEDDHLKKNPWKSVARDDYATKERVLSAEDQRKLEEFFLRPKLVDRGGGRRMQRWLLFMLGTGLRLEECRGIREAEDLNFPDRWVRVTRKSRGRKKKIQDVPLIDPFLLDLLQEQLTEDGQLWHQSQQHFRDVLEDACKVTGVEHISPHTLRHTFATRYLAGGGDIYVLSKILGHSSVSVTEKVYAHLLGDDLLARSKNVKLGLVSVEAEGRVLPFRSRESSR